MVAFQLLVVLSPAYRRPPPGTHRHLPSPHHALITLLASQRLEEGKLRGLESHLFSTAAAPFLEALAVAASPGRAWISRNSRNEAARHWAAERASRRNNQPVKVGRCGDASMVRPKAGSADRVEGGLRQPGNRLDGGEVLQPGPIRRNLLLVAPDQVTALVTSKIGRASCRERV